MFLPTKRHFGHSLRFDNKVKHLGYANASFEQSQFNLARLNSCYFGYIEHGRVMIGHCPAFVPHYHNSRNNSQKHVRLGRNLEGSHLYCTT